MCHLRHRKSGLAQRLRLLDTTGHLGPRLPLAVRDRLGAPGGPSCHLHDPNSLINNNLLTSCTIQGVADDWYPADTDAVGIVEVEGWLQSFNIKVLMQSDCNMASEWLDYLGAFSLSHGARHPRP